MRNSNKIALCLILGVLSAGFSSAESWELFRGTQQLTGVTENHLSEYLQLNWVFEASDGIESTAAISSGTAYVGSLDGYFYALDLEIRPVEVEV